ALLTTAAGLAVAIPAVVALAWLERRVERVRHDMEDAATRVFTSPLRHPGDGRVSPVVRANPAEAVTGHAV
ncbi:MAG TPA: MotA/TolQ/ExbB proton channel family protein, partial [Alphaproteobacteria bacterium]|nr:MotA/TolQ/ExbB proton channel family protein [Alphaproteobacteria bacterium]